MNHHTPSSNRRNLRTFIASLLAYVLLTSQFAPMAMAFNGSADRRTPARRPDLERKNTSETPTQERVDGSFAAVPVPLRVTALGGAPVITATKVDSFPDPDGDGKVSPGQTITYSVTITNTGSAPATNVTLTDTVDPNTTIVPGSPDSTPIAFDDSYNVVGNVRIQPNAAQGLLANDNNPETGNNTGLTASGPTTGPSNGQATVNSDGSFSYNPNPGFTGTDTFDYTVTDSTGETDTATVTLTVGNGAGGGSNVIWFVDAAAAPGGDGRLTNPFNCLVGPGCFDAVAADDPGDTIFLYNGAYTGGLIFLANQKLVGQGATATLATLAGVTPPAYSDPLPATNSNPASVTVTTTAAATNALNVDAGGILLRGFTVGNTTGAKISGNNFGTLTAGNNTMPDLVLSGMGQALNLTNGTFAATSAFLSVATTSSGTQGINLATVAGTVSLGSTTVSGSTTQGILVGTTTANINFGNTAVSGGTDGISLQNNSTGTRTFGTLSVSNNSGVGFLHAVGGGATSAGVTMITNPGGIGISINSSTTAVTFANTNVMQSGGTGVSISGGTGNVTFGDLDITPDSGQRALQATSTTGTITATSGTISATNQGVVDILGLSSANPTPLNLTLDSISSSDAPAGPPAINLVNTSGTFTATTTTVTNPGGIGIGVATAVTNVVGTFSFGNTNVSLSGGTGVVLQSNTKGVNFGILDISPDPTQSGLQITDSSGATSTSAGTISTTDALALNITNSAISMGLTSVSADNTGDPDSCVSFTTTTGSIAMNGGTLTGGTGAAFNVSGGTVTANYFGSITQNSAGRVVNVDGTTGGAISFATGTVTGGAANTGVNINNANGNVSFANLNLGTSVARMTNQAVTITNGTGTYSLGAVSIFTNNVHGIVATNADGTLNSTSGTVDTNGGSTLRIDGPAGLTTLGISLTKVFSDGGTATGLLVQDTNGSFTVTGTGGSCTSSATCTGGSLSNKTGTGNDANGTDAVTLNNATNVSLTRMNISDNNRNGILATSVNGLKLDNCFSNSNADQLAPNESNVRLVNLSGSILAGANPTTITNTSITNGFEHNLEVENGAGITLTDFQITNSTISNNGASTVAGNMVTVIVSGGTSDVTFDQNTMVGNRTAGQLTAAGIAATVSAGTMNVTVTRNSLQNHNAAVDVSASGSGTLNFDITDNGGSGGIANNGVANGIITGSDAIGISVFSQATATGSMNGFIRGNTIGTQGVTSSGSRVGRGMQIQNEGSIQTTVLISGNIVQEIGVTATSGNEGISVQHGIAVAGAAEASNVTNINNTIRDVRNSRAIVHQILNTGNLCSDIGGQGVAGTDKNILTNIFGQGGTDSKLRVNRTNGTHNIRQLTPTAAVIPAELDEANNLSNAVVIQATVSGANNFNAGTCTQPSTFEPEIFIDKIPGPGGRPGEMPKGQPVQQTAAPTNTDSITRRPFITSPRQQPTVTGDTKAAQVVVRPLPAPAPDSTPIGPPPTSEVPKPQPPDVTGDTLTWNVGTLPAGQSVTITFEVVVDNPFMGAMPQVSNQGTVMADGGISVLTDDPSEPGMNDPTVTGVTVPPDLFVRDASVAEPASGSTSMIFTLALSTPAPMSGITVTLSTEDITATGGTCAADDYTTVTGGTVTFAAGEQIKTFPVTVCSDANVEGDETFSLDVISAPGATIADGRGVGTITANVPGTILISELRTSGPGGAGDDFVEIYNNTDTPHTVPTGGYGLFKRGATCDALPELIGTIPAETMIPQRGHYLFVGSAYSLANYGGTGAAVGNQTLAADIESDFNVGLFSTVDPLAISTANRLDAVGFGISTGGVCDVLLEGTTLQPASGSTSEHSFVREFTLVGNNIPTPTDANDNAADFTVVSTTPATPVGSNAAPRLGAPGPENLSNPNLKKFSQVGAQLIDPMVAQSQPPNRVRDTTPDAPNNSTFGTIAIRRTFTNNTGGSITRLRFRIYDITTFPSPVGTADLRARTSGSTTVIVTGVGTVTVQGTTVELPPAQPNGGGLNSSMSAGTVTLATPLADTASINLQFLFGVQQNGGFRVFVFVEALP
jgi:hypothetical protein